MKKDRLVGARLPIELVKELETIESVEQSDRSTTVRKLLARSIRDWKLEHHANRYARNQQSLARSARDAGVTVWEMLEYLRTRKIAAQYDESDLAHDIERLQRNATKA
ncbi:MAG: UPF0175 family protein [Acidobacteria bacterium]|nr:UPF0175 family protein [Acidobacteriota bacterium]